MKYENGASQYGTEFSQKLIDKLGNEIEKRGLTLREVSVRSGVSISTISRSLNYLTTPSMATILELYGAIGIDIEVKGYERDGGEEVF